MSPFLIFGAVLERPLNTFTIRTAVRALAMGVLSVIVVCAVAQAAGQPSDIHLDAGAAHEESATAVDLAFPEQSHAPAKASNSSDTHAALEAPPAGATEGRREEEIPDLLPEPVNPLKKIAFFREAGRGAWQSGDRARAEESFAAALSVNAEASAKRDLMLEMADLYEGAHETLKAIAILEKFHQTNPADTAVPGVLFRLGVFYRDSGAISAAIARFFLVLNSTLRLAPDQFESYRKLSMKARLEIAETYSLQGDHTEARKYYSRLEVLDLDEPDRQRVLFRGAQLQFSLEKWFDAERKLAGFVELYPSSPNAPEARYLRAKALEKLERRDEAVKEVLALLQTQDNAGAPIGQGLAYWKRRTGNELANQFYEQGDITGALSIYQALARASDDPAWRWPAVYQIGLCFERLNLPVRAVEVYWLIVSPENASGAEKRFPESLAAVQSMAKWRLEHLDWVDDFEERLKVLSVDSPAES